jgi:hypothetical protein
MPVSKMAVTDVCQSEMRESQSLLRMVLKIDRRSAQATKPLVLQTTARGGRSGFEEEEGRVKVTSGPPKGAYVTKDTVWPTLAIDVSRLAAQPVAVRGAWFLRQREQSEKQLRKFEQETMLMEETVQRLSWRYIEARNRMEDYNTYYDYAVRYGPMEEEDFHSHAMPGKTYHDRCTRGVRSWQRMWWARWPPRRMWKDICATRMQALWRGLKVRKRWRPIVRMRMHHGR